MYQYYWELCLSVPIWLQWQWSDLQWYYTRLVLVSYFVHVEFFSDINECTIGTDNCDARAVCTNIIGSFTCTCQTGYTGNGVTCTGMQCQALRLKEHFLTLNYISYSQILMSVP